MANTTTAASRTSEKASEKSLTIGQRRTRRNEALLGLLFAAPVTIVGVVFQLFPVVYGFYISLQGGAGSGQFPEGFVGLENFVHAIGSFAYMLALVLSVIFALAGYAYFRRGVLAQAEGGRFYPYLIPGYITGLALLIVFFMAFRFSIEYALIPAAIVIIGGAIAIQMSNQNERAYPQINPEVWMRCLVGAFGTAVFSLCAIFIALFALTELQNATQQFLFLIPTYVRGSASYVFPLSSQFAAFGGLLAGATAIFVIGQVRGRLDPDLQDVRRGWLGIARLMGIFSVAFLLIYVLTAQTSLQRSVDALNRAAADKATGAKIADSISEVRSALPDEIRSIAPLSLAEVLPRLQAWPEVFTMLLGIVFIGYAWYLWSTARHRETSLGMLSTLLIAIFLMIGGWLFIGEIPQAAGTGDTDFYDSLVRTATYALLTVPVQLGIGITLAYLLFHEVRRGKGIFRLIFFVPYIAPTVATAAVFILIFNAADISPMNQLMKSLGLPPQEWLQSQQGVFQILATIIGGRGTRLPEYLAGPSLPLLSAILFAIWVFSGYNAVIFMAGLVNIPKEVYEAAQVDGAGRWQTFRKIVFPLLSPTTFFLTLLAITGTFRAFTHLWVLRIDTRGALDTTAIYIYANLKQLSQPRSYSAALSFLLFGIILVLTIVQNRASRDRVFYG